MDSNYIVIASEIYSEHSESYGQENVISDSDIAVDADKQNKDIDILVDETKKQEDEPIHEFPGLA